MKLTIKGEIKQIGETQTYDSGFEKTTVVITESSNSKYPQDLCVEAMGDRADIFAGFKVGDMVNASCDLRGSEYKGRHFVNISCWKVDAVNDGQSNAPAKPSQPEMTMDDSDSIPF